MTSQQLKEIRKRTGLTQGAFAKAIKYKSKDCYRRYEDGARPVPMLLALLAEMIDKHGLPRSWRH